jgi:transcription antitermination factor NusG
MLAWYTLNTKPQSEARVARVLMARGFEIFLPLLPGRSDQRIKPLFPSYLFVNCDLAEVDVANLKWVPGLRQIISFAGQPAVVPDDAIALIRANLRRIEEQGGLPTHGFRPGDEVVIDQGPLAGLRGIFQGPLGPAERVHILMHFLGEVNRAEVPIEVLRRAPDPAEAPVRRRGTRGRGRRIHYAESADGSEVATAVQTE